MDSDIVIIPTEYQHLIEVREPLLTKAPCPDKTQPYCCYVNTVIFYLKPYVVRPWHYFWICNGKREAAAGGHTFEEWDRLETRLRNGSMITFRGQQFEIYNGRVKWANGRWWMYRDARRKREANTDVPALSTSELGR